MPMVSSGDRLTRHTGTQVGLLIGHIDFEFRKFLASFNNQEARGSVALPCSGAAAARPEWPLRCHPGAQLHSACLCPPHPHCTQTSGLECSVGSVLAEL